MIDFQKYENSDAHLTEEKLGVILNNLFHGKVTPQFKINQYRADYMIELPDTKIIVEFDGFKHYTDANTQYRDYLIHQNCDTNNIKIINIPYWVQLCSQTAEYYFGEYLPTNHSIPEEPVFPHGFVSSKAILPSNFNSSGWNRFTSEYFAFIQADIWSVPKSVFQSLDYRILRLASDSIDIDKARELVIGIDKARMTRSAFIENYPT